MSIVDMESLMSVALPILFALTGLAAALTIWHAVAANIRPIVDLKRRMALPDAGAEIFVTLRDQDFGADDGALARQRRARHAARPKPITHRLHQFARSRSAA
jgi:hypothetical protein